MSDMPEFDLTRFQKAPGKNDDRKPPTVSVADWERFAAMSDAEYYASRQGFIEDTGTERARFLMGPYHNMERIVPKTASEVILHGAMAHDLIDGRSKWPGSYIYKRRVDLTAKAPLPIFDYEGPTPQPKEDEPVKLILP